jgi:uncharacterized membrane protein
MSAVSAFGVVVLAAILILLFCSLFTIPAGLVALQVDKEFGPIFAIIAFFVVNFVIAYVYSKLTNSR